MENNELNKLPDNEIETKIKELVEKKDATQEEKDSLTNLKEERNTRYQKRLDRLTWEKKSQEERASKLELQLEAQRKEVEELKAASNREVKPIIIEEYVEYGGKKYYTDNALQSMVESKELTSQDAYKHQQQRLKAEIKTDIENESKVKENANKNANIWNEDKASVLKEYPQFNPSHADHDPKDPLYVLASEIYNDDFVVEGQVVNPRAMSLSIKRAKQILKTTETRPNVSDEHQVPRPGVAAGGAPQNVTLTQVESDSAIRMYRTVINPKTNKPYTEQEAIDKTLKAKKARGR